MSISPAVAAASCYIEIILKESDNNVKLIVLDRLIALKEQPNQERVLQVCLAFFNLFPSQKSKISVVLGIGDGYPACVGNS